MQKFERLYSYIHEYQQLVYDYYSKIGVAFLTTYYNLNPEETIWEDQDLMGGAYEQTGGYSGIKRNKILLLPVYFIDEVSTSFDGQETGYHKENETSIVIPSSYGITPYPKDIIKFEQSYMRPSNDNYPIFTVDGAEISANTDKRFWKLKVSTFQSETLSSVDAQVENNYVFFDYDKKIHTLADSQLLTKLLYKDTLLKNNLSDIYDQNSGYYFI